jgi:hypothetical protein
MLELQVSKIHATSLSDALKGVNDITESTTIDGFMSSVIGLAIPLSVFSVFILLSFAAYKLMMSKGDPDKLKEAQEVISNAIIGFLFVILSVVILLLLSNLFGIRISGY